MIRSNTHLVISELHLVVNFPDSKDGQSVLTRRGHHSVKVEVAIIVSRDQAVVALEELADFDLWIGTIQVRRQDTFHLLVLVVLHSHVAVVRSGRRALCLLLEVNEVEATVSLAALNLVAELALASLGVVVIEDVQIAVP